MRGCISGAVGLAWLACGSPPENPVGAVDAAGMDAGSDAAVGCDVGAAALCRGAWCWEQPVLTGTAAMDRIAVVGPDDVWAAGQDGLALHWDGSRWRVFRPSELTITSIQARAHDDVWAAGREGLQHWDGCTWSSVPVADGGAGDGTPTVVWTAPGADVWVGTSDSLYRGAADGSRAPRFESLARFDDGIGGIAVGAAGDVWVASGAAVLSWEGGGDFVGRFETPGPIFDLWAEGGSVYAASPTVPVAAGGLYRWDGTTRSEIASGSWWALWGSAGSDVWAVGDAGFARGRGASFTLSPGPSAHDLAGASADEIWAAGNGEILRWDGDRWSYRLGPVEARTPLAAISGFYAVGSAGTVLRREATGWRRIPVATRASLLDVESGIGAWTQIVGTGGTVLATDGSRWVETLLEGSPTLYGVDASSPSDQWIAGTGGAWRSTDGLTWNPVPLDGFSQPPLELRSPFCAGTDDVWAVAIAVDGTAQLVHWDGDRWTASPGLSVAPTAQVFGSGPDDVWLSSDDRLLQRTSEGWTDRGQLSVGDVWMAGPGEFWAVAGFEISHVAGGAITREATGGLGEYLLGVGGDETGVMVVGTGGAILRRSR